MKPDPDPVGGVPPPRVNPAAPGEGTRPTSLDETTGLPGLRRWRAVYLVVTGIVVAWIVLLTILTNFYS